MRTRNNRKKLDLLLNALLPPEHAKALSLAAEYKRVRIYGDRQIEEIRTQSERQTAIYRGFLANTPWLICDRKEYTGILLWVKITDKGRERLRKHEKARSFLLAAVEGLDYARLKDEFDPTLL